MKKSCKRSLAFALSTLMITPLVGCSNTPSNPEPTEAATFEESITWNGVYDVIVVGFGGSGAVSAITAADEGANVLILEKAPLGGEGGNTRYAAGGVSVINDVEKGLKYLQNLRGEWTRPNDTVLRVYVEAMSQMPEWIKSMGGDPQPVPAQPEPGEFPELTEPGVVTTTSNGGQIWNGMLWKMIRENVMKRTDKIDIWYEAPGESLIQDPITKEILGVKTTIDGKELNLRATGGVILCTGGFEANEQMVRENLGLEECRPLGTLYNTGDGIRMAQAVGADLWHMENYSGPYFAYKAADREHVETMTFMKTIGSINTLGTSSSIAVGPDGTRFMNEASVQRHGLIDYHGQWMNPPMPMPMYMVFDENARLNTEICQNWSPNSQEEVEKGWIIKADSIEELATKIDLEPAVLSKTVNQFNEFCEKGEDVQFNRPVEHLHAIGSGPYYAMKLTPVMLNTQGGPVRNENGQVLDTNGNPIPNLYSAGELGGVTAHFYQGGGNLGECLVFGQISGKNAAQARKEASANLVVEPYEYQMPENEVVLADNEKLGVGAGIGGDVQVKVTLDGDTITAVEVVSHHETAGISDKAIAEMPGRIVEANSTDVDTVSGCTVTSKAILEAVNNALK